MPIKQVIEKLTQQGHHVTYYKRKDGGYLIKSIDGQKYTGAMGNKIGRAILGQTLSVKRAEQLYKITFEPESKRQKAIISYRHEKVKEKLKKVQKVWNKAFKESGFKEGKKTAKKVKWNLEHKGEAETMRLLDEAERYAQGKAYSKNIDYLASQVEIYAEDFGSIELQELANDIRKFAYKIEEDGIPEAYKWLYKLDKGVPINEVIRNVRKILKLTS